MRIIQSAQPLWKAIWQFPQRVKPIYHITQHPNTRLEYRLHKKEKVAWTQNSCLSASLPVLSIRIPGTCRSQKRANNPPELPMMLLYGCWESNLGPLEEQHMLLTTEPSPSSQSLPFPHSLTAQAVWLASCLRQKEGQAGREQAGTSTVQRALLVGSLLIVKGRKNSTVHELVSYNSTWVYVYTGVLLIHMEKWIKYS